MQNNRKRTGPGGKGSFSRPKFKGKEDKGGFRKEGDRSFDKKSYGDDRKDKYRGDSEKSYGKKSYSDRKDKYGKDRDDKKPFDKDRKSKYGKGSDRPYGKKSFGDRKDNYGKDADRPYSKKSFGDRDKHGKDSDRPYSKKSFGDRKDSYKKDWDDKKPFERKFEKGSDRPRDKKRFDKEERGGYKKDFGGKDEKRSYGTDRTRKYKEKKYGQSEGNDDRSFSKEKKYRKPDGDNDKPFYKEKKYGRSESGGTDKPFYKKERSSFRKDGDEEQGSKTKHRKTWNEKYGDDREKRPSKRNKDSEKAEYEKSYYNKDLKYTKGHQDRPKSNNKGHKDVFEGGDGLVRLNKYIANAGICSRREADELIKAGAVSVNGKVVTEMGFKVGPDDKINYGGETLRNERKVYLLLNKPKDYITTMDDPRERRTVMELIQGACRERVYPVGRLDRNTSGLLLFTNDGEMATRLMHPKFGIRKIYHVTIGRNMKPEDYAKLLEGMELEDGFIKPDEVSFVGDGRKEIGIEIHSGKNRIVRRIFEHLGYEILKLDRVAFAGLSKKDLPRGKWRFLTPKEVSFLKMVG